METIATKRPEEPARRIRGLLVRWSIGIEREILLRQYSDVELALDPLLRDYHLGTLNAFAIPQLQKQRLTVFELKLSGIRREPAAFLDDHIDEALLWRWLMMAEKHRYLVRVTNDSNEDPRHWLWDVTAEGDKQASGFWTTARELRGLLTVSLIGVLIAAFVAVTGVGKVAATVVILALIAICLAYIRITWNAIRRARLDLLPLVAERERQVQQARRNAGVAPWWPVLPPIRRQSAPGEVDQPLKPS